MTQQGLERLCKKWQRKLRLMDMDIEIYYVHSLDGRLGSSNIDWANGIAIIEIADPVSICAQHKNFVNVELTLVHELLHCLLQPLTREVEGLQAEIQEQTIEKLAKAFLGV